MDALGMWPETTRIIKEGYAKMALFSANET